MLLLVYFKRCCHVYKGKWIYNVKNHHYLNHIAGLAEVIIQITSHKLNYVISFRES